MSKKEQNQMENPYEKFGAHRNEVVASHGALVWMSVVFLAICVLAPVWRTVYDFARPGTPALAQLFSYDGEEPLQNHLRAAEKRIENEAIFVKPIRQRVQGVLTATLKEGNRKAVIGKDGWLVFGPAIQSITGYGPLKPEPDTVAKDPNREPWNGPLDVIIEFGQQLEALDTRLVLVPVPVKPMIIPEALGASAELAPLSHPDAEVFYERLEESGIQVVDLAEAMMEAKAEGDGVFLKQDTHWTPSMMQRAAKVVADQLKNVQGAEEFTAADEKVESLGDLAEKLELIGGGPFENEAVTVSKISGLTVDAESPIVLLGDSFTNIFHAENMGWGTGAGFAEHLAKELGTPIDLIARNGQASTGVRRELANRPEAVKMMREQKKVIVWAIAARDLFLSETPARENQVAWDTVEFRETPADDFATASEEFAFRGTLEFKSPIENPAAAPYPSTVFSAVYKVDEVLEGEYTGERIKVYHWGFIDRQSTEMASYQPGGSYVICGTEMGRAAADPALKLEGVNRTDATEGDDSLMMEYFDLTPAKTGGDDASAARRATMVSGVVALLLIAFGGGLAFSRRRA